MMGMGGLLYIAGDPDRPPLCMPADQAFALAGACAASGTLLAYWYRQNTGEGQQVDVSIQEVVMRSLLIELSLWDFQGDIMKRYGPIRLRGKILQRYIWRCKDGFINWQFFGGSFGARQVRQLVKWMEAEGFASSLKQKAQTWDTVDLNEVTQEEVQSWDEEFQRFISDKTKDYLYKEGIKRGLFLASVNTIKDIAENEQLNSRQFWSELPHSELGEEITYPGAFYTSGEAMPSPGWRAPLIGEHNHEIYCQELGMSETHLSKLIEEGVV